MFKKKSNEVLRMNVNIQLLSDTQINELSAEIDRQLGELAIAPELPISILRGNTEIKTPEKYKQQFETLASATNEPAPTFLSRFIKAAKSDLCEEGGSLHTQWKKWGDVENSEVIRTYAGVLAGMGVSGNLIPVLVVPLAVLTINITIKTICEEYS